MVGGRSGKCIHLLLWLRRTLKTDSAKVQCDSYYDAPHTFLFIVLIFILILILILILTLMVVSTEARGGPRLALAPTTTAAAIAVVPGSGTVRWPVGWCCGSCGNECVSNKSIVSRLTSNQQFHKKQDSLPNSHLSSLIQRPDGGYGYMTHDRERAVLHQPYLQQPRQWSRNGAVAPLQLWLLSAQGSIRVWTSSFLRGARRAKSEGL